MRRRSSHAAMVLNLLIGGGGLEGNGGPPIGTALSCQHEPYKGPHTVCTVSRVCEVRASLGSEMAGIKMPCTSCSTGLNLPLPMEILWSQKDYVVTSISISSSLLSSTGVNQEKVSDYSDNKWVTSHISTVLWLKHYPIKYLVRGYCK